MGVEGVLPLPPPPPRRRVGKGLETTRFRGEWARGWPRQGEGVPWDPGALQSKEWGAL